MLGCAVGFSLQILQSIATGRLVSNYQNAKRNIVLPYGNLSRQWTESYTVRPPNLMLVGVQADLTTYRYTITIDMFDI